MEAAPLLDAPYAVQGRRMWHAVKPNALLLRAHGVRGRRETLREICVTSRSTMLLTPCICNGRAVWIINKNINLEVTTELWLQVLRLDLDLLHDTPQRRFQRSFQFHGALGAQPRGNTLLHHGRMRLQGNGAEGNCGRFALH